MRVVKIIIEYLGTLAPSLRPSKLNDTIDLIFATHWIYPSQTPVLQADDEKCVNDELSKRSGMDLTPDLPIVVLVGPSFRPAGTFGAMETWLH